jgi:diketogulonate reductase-like aldo/keto reductase/GNAT superfamily N-acetyltransferase
MKTKHVKLSPHDPADLLALLASVDEYEKSVGMRVAHGVRDHLLAALPDFIAQLRAAAAPDPWKLSFAVVQWIDNVVIGLCGFTGAPDADGIAEIAYSIAPEYQGKGYATETAQALVDYAVASGRVSVVRAHTLAETDASTRVLEKCGFNKTGTIVDPENNLVWRWELALAPHSKKGGKTTRADITRREAARIIGAGMAGALLPITAPRMEARAESAAMLMRAIPSSGEKLPVIGLGTWSVFDVDLTPENRTRLAEVMSLFVKRGGRVIDSSPMYGRAEGVIGELAAQLRLHDSLFIATKVWTTGKEAGIAMMQRSMERFRTNRIDLMQVHNLVDVDNQMSSLREWKTNGRIRYTGITHSQARGFYEVERIMRSQKPDFVQINYSVMEPGAAQRILPLAQELRMAVIINRPFGGGGLFRRVAAKSLPPWAVEIDCRSWAQFFLKWIVAHPAVTCVIPATNNPQHIEDNMAAGLGRLPDAKMRQRMIAFVSSL